MRYLGILIVVLAVGVGLNNWSKIESEFRTISLEILID